MLQSTYISQVLLKMRTIYNLFQKVPYINLLHVKFSFLSTHIFFHILWFLFGREIYSTLSDNLPTDIST